MSFLYKRLAKLGEIAAKKDIEEKSEELKYVRTILARKQKTIN
jgi:hypothetical protein